LIAEQPDIPLAELKVRLAKKRGMSLPMLK